MTYIASWLVNWTFLPSSHWVMLSVSTYWLWYWNIYVSVTSHCDVYYWQTQQRQIWKWCHTLSLESQLVIFRLEAILVIMSGSTFKTAIVLYSFRDFGKDVFLILFTNVSNTKLCIVSCKSNYNKPIENRQCRLYCCTYTSTMSGKFPLWLCLLVLAVQ